jgi:MFS family permease
MKNYWIYFWSSLISLIGSNYFIFTHGWYILQLTGQKASVGLTFTLFFLPGLICMPLVGKLLDSVPLKKLLLSFEAYKLFLFITFTIALHFYPLPALVYALAVLYGIAFAPYFPSVYIAVKRLVPSDKQTRFSHISETSLQIANIVSVFSSGFIFQSYGFLVLMLFAAVCILLGSIGMLKLDLPQEGEKEFSTKYLFSGYKEVGSLIKGRSELSREHFLFGVFHQLPQAVIMSGNIPLLLYVSETMHKGPKEFGVLDALIGVAAFGVSLLWTRWHKLSESPYTQIIVTLLAGITTVGIVFLPPTGASPYFWMLAYGGFLISSKILARATVVRRIPKEQMGLFSTFFQTCGCVMMLSLFFLIGWLNKTLSPTYLFAILGGILIVYAAGLCTIHYYFRKEKTPELRLVGNF